MSLEAILCMKDLDSQIAHGFDYLDDTAGALL